jgi:hypothetical protein
LNRIPTQWTRCAFDLDNGNIRLSLVIGLHIQTEHFVFQQFVFLRFVFSVVPLSIASIPTTNDECYSARYSTVHKATSESHSKSKDKLVRAARWYANFHSGFKIQGKTIEVFPFLVNISTRCKS